MEFLIKLLLQKLKNLPVKKKVLQNFDKENTFIDWSRSLDDINAKIKDYLHIQEQKQNL